ncbi:hypothetical protein G7Y79_00095g101290 [Physcia stellaris]|nr:hypothetical protein G7Y79_00095g101290 [Physcia stellaris]
MKRFHFKSLAYTKLETLALKLRHLPDFPPSSVLYSRSYELPEGTQSKFAAASWKVLCSRPGDYCQHSSDQQPYTTQKQRCLEQQKRNGESQSESAGDRSESGSLALSDLGDSIDIATFEQILEMDDDEREREFSKGIVFGFFGSSRTDIQKHGQGALTGPLPQRLFRNARIDKGQGLMRENPTLWGSKMSTALRPTKAMPNASTYHVNTRRREEGIQEAEKVLKRFYQD